MAMSLEGIRVLDLTQALNGPFCAMLLGHLGAEVIKVEFGNGDGFRKLWLDPAVAARRDSYEFLWVNQGKKGITLNLTTPRGKEIFKDLIKQSDIVVENFSAGTMERLGFGYDEIRDVNPRIIYATGKGFGTDGPNHDRHAAAPIAMGSGGWTDAAWLGDKWWNSYDRPAPGTKVIGPGDEGCGVSMVVGILAALFHRERSGEGQMIEVSMQEAIVGFLISQLHEYFEDQPVGNAPMECKDGFYTFTGALRRDDQWKKLCVLMEREDLLTDPRFESSEARRAYADDLDEIVGPWMKTQTRQELWEKLEPLHSVNGPVLNISEVVEDPHMKARGAWHQVTDTDGGSWPMLNPWIRLSATPTVIQSLAPAVGQHNYEVYGQLLGYSRQQVDDLAAEGVIA